MEKFEKMIGGLQPVESDLHRHLIEHLNAEVVLQTITDLEVAMRWLSSTFLYVRARKNPRYYGLTSSDPSLIDRRLLEMCQIELNKLIKAGMLTIDQDVLLRASPVGAAMAKYYLFFETMKLFTQIGGNEVLQQILSVISKCHEFSENFLRVNDKKCLNLLNKCRDKQTIRFPLSGKIKTLDMKINCIIQAVLGCLDIYDHSLLTETLKIMRNGERIVHCLKEYLESKNKCFQALLSAITLAKCFRVQLWENSPYVTKQLPGIGNVTSSLLVNAGKTTFQTVLDSDPRELEILMNKKPPAGTKMQEQIQHLPKYNLRLEPYGKNKVRLSISLRNALDLETTCTVNRNSLMFLLVGDSCNNVLLYEKYSHSFLIESPDVVRFIDFQENCVEDLEVHFVSEDWVGIDCSTKLQVAPKPKEVKTRTPKISKKIQNDELTYMQKFMEMYMQCKKNKDEQVDTSTNDEESSKENDPNNAKKTLNESNSQIIIHGNVTIVDKDGNKCQKNDADARGKLKSIENIGTILTKDAPKQSRSPKDESSSENPDSLSSGDKVETLKTKFAFTPKQWTHKRCVDINETPTKTGEPPQKRRDLDTKPKLLKITWRSPLTYSPPVKFSPKVDQSNRSNVSCDQNSFSTSRESSSTSLTTSNQEVPSQKKTKLSTSFQRTPLKPNSSQKIVFPLSDKEYADSSLASLEDSIEKRDEIIEKVGDFVSTSFLEDCGLVQPSPKQKVQSQIRTPNEYYRQLLTQTQSQDKEGTPRRQVCRTREESYGDEDKERNKKLTETIIVRRESGKKKVAEGSRNERTGEMRRGVVDNRDQGKMERVRSQSSNPFHSGAKSVVPRSESSERRKLPVDDNRVDQRKTERVDSQIASRNNRVTCEDRGKSIFSKPASSERIKPNVFSATESPYFGRDVSNTKSSDIIKRVNLSKLQTQRAERSQAATPSKSSQFQELPSAENPFLVGHQRHVSHESDPFNDSLDVALMECEIPSPLLRNDHDNTISRQNSGNFVAYENKDNNRNERPPSRRGDMGHFQDSEINRPRIRCRDPLELLPNDGHEVGMTRNSGHYDEYEYVDDDAFYEMMDDDEVTIEVSDNDDGGPSEQTSRENYNYLPSNYGNRPEDVYAANTNSYQQIPQTITSQDFGQHAGGPFFERNSNRFAFSSQSVQRQEGFHFRGSDSYHPTHCECPRLLADSCIDEGYSYLRRTMEMDDDPFLRRQAVPNRVMCDLERSNYPERIPTQNTGNLQFDDAVSYGYENSLYRGYNHPSRGDRRPDVVPRMEDYSDLAYSYAERRQHRRQHPRPRKTRKNGYIIRKFLNNMNN